MPKIKLGWYSFLCIALLLNYSVVNATSYHSKKYKTAKKITLKRTVRPIVRKPSSCSPLCNLPVTNAQGIVTSPDVFDKRVLALLQRWQIPGGSITVMRNDQIVVSRGYGYGDLENQIPAKPDSVFRIASVSKAITSVAILQLVQQGKLDLDDKAYGVLNQLAPLHGDMARNQIYQVTVKNLLQMSSGWSTSGSGAPDPMFGPWTLRMAKLLDYDMPPDCLNAARLMMSIPMQFRPGAGYSYSNINYCMLGLIINRVTGLQGDIGYQNYIRQTILEPQGIYSMQIGESDPMNRTTNEVKYYRNGGYDTGSMSGLPYSTTNIIRKNFSDGGWIATSKDLAKFLQALQHYRILNKQMLETMTERPEFQHQPEKYFAMGWSVRYLNGHRYVYKTGSFTGTYALVVMKDDGTSYAAVFNSKPWDRGRFIAQLQSILFST